jgi:hypothetical protein
MTMQTATRGSLQTIAGQLAVIAGVLHLGLGMYYSVGGPGALAGDRRIVLWLAAGAALVGGVVVAAVGWQRERLYKAGIGIVGSLVAMHFLWPMVASGNFYLGPPQVGGLGPVGQLVALVVDARPIAKVTLGVELVLLAVLVVLVVDAGPR